MRFQSWTAQGLGALREAQWDVAHADDAAGLYAIARTFGADGGDPDRSAAILAAAIEAEPAERVSAAHASASAPHMGAALTVLDLAAGRIDHVGDAIVVLRRDDTVRPLTEAHTLANVLRAAGESIPAAQPSVLVRALGFDRAPAPDTISYTPQAGDTVLLLSGGLARLTDLDRLAPIMGAVEPSGAVRWMIERATERGAADNLTAVLIRV